MEETISLKEIFEVIKKRLWLIVSLIVGAAVIAAIVSYFFLTPKYEASSMFVVNQQPQDPAAQYSVNDIRTNIELINTYNVIIKSPRILEQVVEELNLGYTADQLSNKIAVASAESSQVVTVTVTDPNPVLAVEIANTTVNVFQDEIPQLLNVDNVHILSEAELVADPSPVSPNPPLNIAIAIVIGAMAGVGIAFLLEYLDNTVKTEEDIEKELGVPVLGVVSHVTDDDVRVEHFKSAPTRRRGGLDGAQKKSI